jgi:hypothetical protein
MSFALPSRSESLRTKYFGETSVANPVSFADQYTEIAQVFDLGDFQGDF